MMRNVWAVGLTLAALLGASACGTKEAPKSEPAPQTGAALPATVPNPNVLVLDLGSNTTLKLARIPAGTFLMGSPEAEKGRRKQETQHQVTLSKPFFMGVTPITVDQFAAFVHDSGYQTEAEKDGWSGGFTIRNGQYHFQAHTEGASWRHPSFEQTGSHPVVQVDWTDAQAFCAWLSQKTSRTVLLPTEAQWEYACRAGTTTTYEWGDRRSDGRGWLNGSDQSLKRIWLNAPAGWTFLSWDDGFVFTAPVASFKPNAFGLYDMIGNVEQWCSDHSRDYAPRPETDPVGPPNGTFRVVRGASWMTDGWEQRSARRSGQPPERRFDYVGFRVTVAVPDGQ